MNCSCKVEGVKVQFNLFPVCQGLTNFLAFYFFAFAFLSCFHVSFITLYLSENFHFLTSLNFCWRQGKHITHRKMKYWFRKVQKPSVNASKLWKEFQKRRNERKEKVFYEKNFKSEGSLRCGGGKTLNEKKFCDVQTFQSYFFSKKRVFVLLKSHCLCQHDVLRFSVDRKHFFPWIKLLFVFLIHWSYQSIIIYYHECLMRENSVIFSCVSVIQKDERKRT